VRAWSDRKEVTTTKSKKSPQTVFVYEKQLTNEDKYEIKKKLNVEKTG